MIDALEDLRAHWIQKQKHKQNWEFKGVLMLALFSLANIDASDNSDYWLAQASSSQNRAPLETHCSGDWSTSVDVIVRQRVGWTKQSNNWRLRGAGCTHRSDQAIGPGWVVEWGVNVMPT